MRNVAGAQRAQKFLAFESRGPWHQALLLALRRLAGRSSQQIHIKHPATTNL
jgi:hypothetical protein